MRRAYAPGLRWWGARHNRDSAPHDAQNENSQWIVEYVTSLLPLISNTAIRNKAEQALGDSDGFSLLHYEVFPKNRTVSKQTIPAVNINMRITSPSTMDPDKDFYCFLLHSFSLSDCADGASAGSCRLPCTGHDSYKSPLSLSPENILKLFWKGLFKKHYSVSNTDEGSRTNWKFCISPPKFYCRSACQLKKINK